MPELSLDDILTPAEAAGFLKVEVKRLMKLIKRGEIPARRIARGDYRLSASAIKKWLDEWQPNTFDPNKRASEIIREINGKKKTGI